MGKRSEIGILTGFRLFTYRQLNSLIKLTLQEEAFSS
jgi:hypothetical protein